MKTRNIVAFACILAASLFPLSFVACDGGDDPALDGDQDIPADGDEQEAAVEEELTTEVDGDDTDEPAEEGTEEPAEQETTDTNAEVIYDIPTEDGYAVGPYGRNVGDIMANFELLDCDGNPVNLKQYFGQVKAVFINQSAGWCTVCQSEADRMEQIYNDFKDDGLIILQAMFEDNAGKPADSAFCQSWRNTFGLTFPVLVDNLNYFAPFHPNYPSSIATPLNMLIDRNMRIHYVVEGLYPQSLEGMICALTDREDCFAR